VRTDHRCTCQVIDGPAVRRCDRSAGRSQAAVVRGRPPQQMPFSLRMRTRSRRWAARTLGVASVGVAPAQVYRCSSRVWTVWLGSWESARVNCRSDPKCASIGLTPGGVGRGEAQLDLVLLRPAADLVAHVGGEVVQDDVDRGAVGAGGPDRLQGRESVGRAFAAAVDASQGVVTDGVAAVEIGDAVGAVVGRRQPVGPAALGPAGPCWAGFPAGRTRPRRMCGPGSAPGLAQCGRAWRRGRGRSTPSTSWCTGR
jgi:hypothetical protein